MIKSLAINIKRSRKKRSPRMKALCLNPLKINEELRNLGHDINKKLAFAFKVQST